MGDNIDTRYFGGQVMWYAQNMTTPITEESDWWKICEQFVQDHIAYHEGHRHSFTPMKGYRSIIYKMLLDKNRSAHSSVG